MQLRSRGMDHIALKVTDMDRALHFYHEVLGLPLVRSSGPNGGGGRSAVIQAGQQRIDLFSRPDFVSSDKDKPVGMDHVCLVMEGASAEELMSYLAEAGVEIFWAPVVRADSTSVYVYDPDGVHVELRLGG